MIPSLEDILNSGLDRFSLVLNIKELHTICMCLVCSLIYKNIF